MNSSTLIEPIIKPVDYGKRRPAVLYAFLLGTVALLIGRSFYLQIIRGVDFHVQAEGNRVAILPRMAARGIMYDHFNTQLVENVASTDVVLDPILLPPEENEAPLLDRLPNLLTMSPDDVYAAITEARDTQRIVPLKKALDHEEVLQLENERAFLPGAQLVSSSVRHYVQARPLAHILGYSSRVTAEELEADESLLRTDATGKVGLERQYDDLLRGIHGAVYTEVDAAGRPQKSVGEDASVAGADLTLTIDSEFQSFIFDQLTDRIKNKADETTAIAASVIALDPRDGSIRALVNYPSYDPNSFAQPHYRDGAVEFLADSSRPLLNRAIAGTYPPGSTIKPFLAAAGLHDGVITPTTVVQSTGGISVGPWYFPDWKPGGHGPTTLTRAIADSVNTFFYVLAGGDSTHKGLGVEAMSKYLKLFSWGSPTGIDLPGEQAGLLPSPEWKGTTKHEPWYIGDTYHYAIGQGDVLATPLQVAVATGAIANGGTLFQPRILESYHTANEPRVPSQIESQALPFSHDDLAIVRQGMREAVTDGSARSLLSLPLTMAGKTGTAQFGPTDKTHAWFTSFGPYENPELVVTILFEEGGKGDVVAVPMAREIWQWWADHRRR